ncbi:MAG: type VI secretion system Vgr family protein [Planctomycetota bacterium]|jgi:type VI secretion system secreted protein VgrG
MAESEDAKWASRDVAIQVESAAEDAFMLTSFSGTEQLGRPFQYEVEMSTVETFEASNVIGKNLTIRLYSAIGGMRYFNGFVSRFTRVSSHRDDHTQYRATVVSWLWFLTQTADCRIFQNKTIPDIIQEVFEDYGFSEFVEKSLTNEYGPWEYCVQYRETAFDFVSRLMEQHGIYYFFRHENGKHTLVLADSSNAHESFSEDYEEIRHRPHMAEEDKEVITQWKTEVCLQPHSYALKDFDFEKPQTDLEARSLTTREHAVDNMEIYDYPGEYAEAEEGEAYAKIRIEELHTQNEVATAVSDARGICAGCVFTLKECPHEDQNKEYLITSANYKIDAGSYESGGTGETTYSCSFTAIDSKQPYRSLRTTPKPSISGPQTAIVTGPSGEEIWTDEYGRVKVQFHWDRRSSADENSSCWVRVAQVWAGKSWGAIYTPRIGQEVIVEFLEGNPDRPIITGRVYNAENMPPYALPDEKTKSILKSNSSKGGGGFNEIRFEDKKDSEQIFIHAQKDQDVRVLNDSKEWIGNNRHLIVKKDQLEKVEGDKHLSVMGNQNEKIDGTISVKAGMDKQEKAGMNYALEAGTNIHIKGGMNVVIEGGMQLSLKAGGSFVDIGPAGVSISGAMVNINSGGAAGSGAGCSPEAPKAPKEADTAEPGGTEEPPIAEDYSAQAMTLQWCAIDGAPFCEQCEKEKNASE